VAHETNQTLKLPVLVAGPVDVNRLVRELEAIDDVMLQLKLRKGGEAVRVPKTSQLMDQTIQLNKLNLLHEADRKSLSQFLAAVKKQSPVLHISFSADPSVVFIEKLMTWLRREIHPQVLLTIGLQPTIGAGCMVRGASHYFDFTLRHKFDGKRELLLKKLAAGETPAAEAVS
jgi:hypothetical protein